MDNIPGIQRERWELSCCICKQRMGAKIQCALCYQVCACVCACGCALQEALGEVACVCHTPPATSPSAHCGCVPMHAMDVPPYAPCSCPQPLTCRAQAYHPLCGRMAGLHMEVAVAPGGKGLKRTNFCPRHCKPHPKLSGEPLPLSVCAPCASLLRRGDPSAAGPTVTTATCLV